MDVSRQAQAQEAIDHRATKHLLPGGTRGRTNNDLGHVLLTSNLR